MSEFDCIIIGGGHNGLVTAVTLAQANKKVLLLEQRPLLGGAAATEAVFSGYQFNTGAHDAALFRDEIIDALSLTDIAFQQGEATLFAPQMDGMRLTLWQDTARSCEAIHHFSPADAKKWPSFQEAINRMAGLLGQMMLLAPPDLEDRHLNDLFNWSKIGLKLKRQGNDAIIDLLRVLPMPVQVYLDEWFESKRLKGALAATGILGLRQGPRAAGTMFMFLYQQTGGFLNTRFVQGGIGQLSHALAQTASQHGAEIRTNTTVARILISHNRATGVELSDGTLIHAPLIISNATPQHTLFQLVGAQQLPVAYMRATRNIIYRGSTAKLNIALNGLPTFLGQTETDQLTGRIRISPTIDYLERAYDDAKYGRISAHPFLDITIPSLHDTTLAPVGHHILSVHMQYAPYELREGDWQAQRDNLQHLIIETLNRYAPGLSEQIVQTQLLTPYDWEQQFGLTEGSIYHGQMGLDQLLIMRPIPGWSRYQTPITNLYLCGAGTHPGGGVTGAPGYNAAREILRIGVKS